MGKPYKSVDIDNSEHDETLEAKKVSLLDSKGTLSIVNSTTTPLGINGVFTGTAEDIKDFAAINIAVFTDQASATNGLSIEWSPDGTNWDEKIPVSIGASKVESYEFGIRARYFRLVYTNGGIAQTEFRLQVMYHLMRTRTGARCLCVDIDEREFAPTRRAILAAKKPDNTYTNIHATAGGNLKVSIEEQDTGAGLATEAKQDALIHAEHSAHSSTDKGIMSLGVLKTKDYDVSMPDEGDYTKLSMNQTGALRTASQLLFPIVHCNSTDGFTVLGNDTTNIATNLKHLHGTASLSFDKVDGADNTVFAGVQKTITSLSLTKVQGVLGYLHSMVYLSSITDCDYFFVRLGTDSSNYNEWRIDVDENWTAGEWNYVQINIGQTKYAGGTGNGWNPSAITYMASGIAFNTETDTLAGILVDRIGYASGMISTVDMAATITSDISSPNINVHKIGNKVVDKQAGNVDTGTQRFTIADDDTNMAAINNSTSSFDTPTTTALALTTADTQYKLPATELTGRRQIILYNVSDTSVYIGSSSVTTTTGILLATGETMTLDVASDLYAVCGTDNKIVNILELK